MRIYFAITSACLLIVSLSACSLATPQPADNLTIINVGRATSFANGSVTAVDLPTSFNDPDPAAIGSATPGVVTRLPVAAVSPIHIFLVRESTGNFLALYARDPRNGCQIKWVEQQKLFADPCHGSQYSVQGLWLIGPSPRSMDTFKVIVAASGDVTVDVGQFQMGSKHP